MAPYEPTDRSLRTHAVPAWYHDAKLGIFIHWGIYSVPAWAPDPETDHAYAEWYPYYMYVEGSPTYDYHRETYGADVEYIDFAEEWTAGKWDPDRWAAFFADVGARYVVLTGEHHDGFPLWPSHYTSFDAGEMGPKRDVVGELAEAVREYDMRFAASYHANLNYYQPGFEGPFGHPDYGGTEPFVDTDPGPEYVDFMNAKHRELIRRYEPDMLWFDTPQADADQLRARELIADYYNRAEEWGTEVLVNDRAATDYDGLAGLGQDEDGGIGGDVATPEYATFEETKPFKWETCRGIGHSFGYNAREDSDDHLSAGELIHLFVDVVSKNGNLLINVGPRADGTIPEQQRRPLEGLGAWLDVHGEAIFGTRPWVIAEDRRSTPEVRYTWCEDTLYAIALDRPDRELELEVPSHVDLEAAPQTALLTPEGSASSDASLDGSTLTIEVPAALDEQRAYVCAIEGIENPGPHG